jgi:hypothetical protein
MISRTQNVILKAYAYFEISATVGLKFLLGIALAECAFNVIRICNTCLCFVGCWLSLNRKNSGNHDSRWVSHLARAHLCAPCKLGLRRGWRWELSATTSFSFLAYIFSADERGAFYIRIITAELRGVHLTGFAPTVMSLKHTHTFDNPIILCARATRNITARAYT